MAQGGWNLDIGTRCVQEVVDAGEVRILQQQKRKKRWRGQWGKSTHGAKWMQETERHLGGGESSTLKQDERKKLLRYARTYLSSPLSSFSDAKDATDAILLIDYSLFVLANIQFPRKGQL